MRQWDIFAMHKRYTLLVTMAFVNLCGLAAGQSQMDQATEAAAADAMRTKPLTDEEFQLQLEPEFAAKVDACITQLAAPDYVTRQEAAKGLLEIGAPIFNKLRIAYHRADDLETRLRIEEVAHSAYLNYHVLDNHGFLGISMRPYDPAAFAQIQQQVPRPAQAQQANRPALPPGRVGLSVEQVIPNTGAARAGLQRSDILIGLNGRPITGSGAEISNNFSAIIRSLRPGATVDLEVVRGEEMLNIQAVLARPPEDVARDSRIIVVSSLYRVADERFARWWAEYFVAAPAESPTEER